MIKQTLTEFISFLKKPTDIQWNISFTEKLKIIFILFTAEVILFWACIYPIIIGMEYFITLKSPRLEYNETLLFRFLMFVILAPIFEELMFRWILRRQTLIYSLVPQREWDKAFPYLVYFTAISFGFAHMNNYNNEETLFYILLPIILASQFTGGIIITFVRVRFNVFWGMFYHSLWNFSMAFMVMVAWDYFQSPYQEKTENYSIEVSEKHFFDDNQKQSLKIDSANGKIYKMEVEQYSFQHLLDTLYQKDKYYTDDVFLKLKFKSNKGISKSEFLEILKKEYDIK